MTLADLARNGLSGGGAQPGPLRVGMALSFDPSPFILAGEALKLRAPGEAPQTVAGIGRLARSGEQTLRLYLDADLAGSGRLLLQLMAQPGGGLAECRLFGLIEEARPATPEEWAEWTLSGSGRLGQPGFAIAGGRDYARVWNAGAGWAEPRRFMERIEAERPAAREQLAQLYAAPTGLPEPAPQTEYILAARITRERAAWVALHAGIDLDPASITVG